jgi:urease accessory protein
MDAAAGIGAWLHPLATPAHIIALTGLGLVAGRSTQFTRAAIVAAFALGLATGLLAVAQGVGETSAGDALLANATLCGLAAASGIAAPTALAVPVVFACGIALGLDSPPETISYGEAVATLIASAAGGVAALALTTLATAAAARYRDGIALRVAGSWVAAIAILVLALRWAA